MDSPKRLPPELEEYADRRNLRPATREIYAYVIARLEKEDPPDPVEWLIELLRDAPLGTVLPYRAAVKHYLIHVMGMNRGDVAERLPETRGRFPARAREALGKDQLLEFVQTVRAWQPSAVRTILLLLPLTGLRITEACSLPLAAVTPTGLEVLGKRGKTRKLPLTTAVRAIIEDWLESGLRVESEYLFPSSDPTRPVEPTAVRHAFRRRGLKKQFGEHFSPHVLRHSFATSALRRKVDLTRIQELLGHEDISTTAKYLHLDPESRREAMESIEREILGEL